jgi:hypothetical protein
MLNAGDVKIEGRVMDHAKGAWAGSRPQWWTATHVATGLSVTWHDCTDVPQWKALDTALSCLDLLIEGVGAKCPPISLVGDDGNSK